MRPLSTRLLTTLVTLGLLLSNVLVDVRLSDGTRVVRAATPEGDSAAIAAPALVSEQTRRKQARRHERRHERDQEHQRDHMKAERSQDRTKAGRVGDWQAFCTGPESIPLLTTKGCTHGPDPAPPGFDVSQPVAPLSAEAIVAVPATMACDGDGQSGHRIQVLYVRGNDVPSRYTAYLSSIRAWTGVADQIFQTSAAATGGDRRLRVVHDATCQPIVTEVVVSPAGDGGFNSTIAELQSQGFTRADRIYLAFVDTTSAGICGIGTIWSDDRADGNVNWNNFGPSFSRVDAGCWSGDVAAHELMHNLGGVQLSAPNTSGGFHCIDEYDVMCYKDTPSSPDTRRDCPLLTEDKTQLDCGHQDYYHTSPASGSYLATFWNPANNRFLIGAPPPPPPPPSAAPVPSVDDKNKNKQGKKSKGKKGKGKKGKGKKGKGHGKGKRKH